MADVEEIDVVVYCTGYRITFPFLDEEIVSAPDNQVPFYRYVVDPDNAGLYFVGLIQPLGAIMPLAEAAVGVDRRLARGQGGSARRHGDAPRDRPRQGGDG